MRAVRFQLLGFVRIFVTLWIVACPGSSVHGVFQARILEQVTISYSRGSSGSRDQKTDSLLLSHQGFPVQGVKRIKRVHVCPLINLHSHHVDEVKRVKNKNNAANMSL